MNLADLKSKIQALPSEVISKPDRLFSFVLDTYRSDRIDGTSLEEDGDMLLFQWGAYDWGQGMHFELDLTRQAVPSGQEDPPIYQLHCTYRYDPSQFASIVAGNRWCYSPTELDEFRSFVFVSDVLHRAKTCVQTEFELLLEDVE